MSKNVKIKLELKDGSAGNMLVIVRFDPKSSNYNSEDCSWCPTLDELKVLEKAVTFMEK